jgi:endogenous inhibitor of DNA gyrase (YacG/DUF329 family)
VDRAREAPEEAPMKCPTCRQPVENEKSPWRPFCSRRCKLIDLGRWLDGSYALPGEEVEEDEEPVEDSAASGKPPRPVH